MLSPDSHAWGGAHTSDAASEGESGGELHQHFIFDFKVLRAAAEQDGSDTVDGLYATLTFATAVIVSHVYGGFGAKDISEHGPGYARAGSTTLLLRLCSDGSCSDAHYDVHSASSPTMQIHGARAGLLREGEGQTSIMAVDVLCETSAERYKRLHTPPPQPRPPPAPESSPAPRAAITMGAAMGLSDYDDDLEDENNAEGRSYDDDDDVELALQLRASPPPPGTYWYWSSPPPPEPMGLGDLLARANGGSSAGGMLAARTREENGLWHSSPPPASPKVADELLGVFRRTLFRSLLVLLLSGAVVVLIVLPVLAARRKQRAAAVGGSERGRRGAGSGGSGGSCIARDSAELRAWGSTGAPPGGKPRDKQRSGDKGIKYGQLRTCSASTVGVAPIWPAAEQAEAGDLD